MSAAELRPTRNVVNGLRGRLVAGFAVTLLVGVAGGLAASPASTVAQDSFALSRLQQELNSVRFKLEFESDRLSREVESLRSRLQNVEYRGQGNSTLPRPQPRPTPVPDAGNELTVERLVVSDSEGRVRIVLGVSDRFGPMLGLIDEHGGVRGMLMGAADGARLELYDGAGGTRLRLGLEPQQPTLELFDERGEMAVRLGVVAGEQGESRFALSFADEPQGERD